MYAILEFALCKLNGHRIFDLPFLDIFCFELENSTDTCQVWGDLLKGNRVYVQVLIGFELLNKAILGLKIVCVDFVQKLGDTCLDGQKMDVTIRISFK